jgi:hypothetical protein
VNVVDRPFINQVIEGGNSGQAWREIMSFFERLKTQASAEWRAYTEHPFTAGLADGTLPEEAFAATSFRTTCS